MVSNNVTLVIPTYNMSTHIFGLWNSINTSNLIEYISEIIFVNDGSTDDTLQVLTSLKKNDTRNIIKILNLESNQGRFMARYLGVLEANSSQILFLDSRIELPNNFGYELSVAIRDYPNIVGSVDIDTTRNAFCLYWDRTHKKIFKKHYDDANDVIVLDEDNYDSYLKGTTVFFCQKENFISSCSKYKDTPLLNDDTYLMKDMVRSQPIAIHPKVRITWVPRENLKDFLVRMWERGPSFVEYHLFSSRGIFFYIILFLLLLLFFLFAVAISSPVLLLYIVSISLFLLSLSTAFFSKSIREFYMMVPIHVLTIIVFGVGIIYGIFINIRRKI